MKRTLAERVMSYVDKSSGDCWLWTGAKANGYGRVYVDGRVKSSHRVVYELLIGPIPEGLELDHCCHSDDLTCRGGGGCPHRACVNPAHMEPVVQRVNLLRGRSPAAQHAQKTRCRNGHDYTPENTYAWRGTRHCRICRDDVSAQRDRPRPPRRVLSSSCVMCGSAFEYERGPGGQAPNVCSEACRAARKRRAAREHQRRKRAAALPT